MLNDAMRLTPAQGELLIAMDDGPEQDSVGLDAATLTGYQFRTADSLVRLGLAKLEVGHIRFSSTYYRLTGKGRDMLKVVR